MMRERLIFLVSSFWLPLPFLTIKGVDRGEEKAELWFLVVLHSLENFLIVLVSRMVHLPENYPLGIIIFDCIMVFLNVLGVLVTVFYVTKIELYAGLPKDLPQGLPSFGAEVRKTDNIDHCIGSFSSLYSSRTSPPLVLRKPTSRTARELPMEKQTSATTM